MSLDHILLGLIRQPLSGSDIRLWFDRAFHHFWAAEPSQIYRTLKRLETEGLADVEVQQSPRGPPQRVFTITAKGLEALHTWLASGPEMSDTRMSQLAQVLFLAELDDEDRARFLWSMRDEYEQRLAQLKGVVEGLEGGSDAGAAHDDEDFFRRLTVDAGIHQYESWITWIDRSLDTLSRWSPNDRARTNTGSHNEGDTHA